MKKLNTFKSFDLEAFLKGKKLTLKSIRPVDTDSFKGMRAELIITEDNTNYGKDKEGNDVIGSNMWETFTVRIAGATEENCKNLKLNRQVRIVSYSKASAWKPEGAFEESLSVDGVIAPLNENQH